MKFHAATLLALLFTCELRAEILAPTDWPQWRGPERNGLVAAKAWPTKLQGQLTNLWRVALAPSYSSPIVVADRVFTTETVNKEREAVRAFERRTGRELWKHDWPGALSVPFFAKSNGDWIRATPACDGERLYVAGMRDVLVCLDARDGRELWRVDFVKDTAAPLPAFGFVSSPLVAGDFVYAQAGASLAQLDKRTGKIRWRTLRDAGGMWGSVFSSPVLATLGGQSQLVVLTREKLAGIEPADGKVLWEQKVEALRGMNILTPVIYGDHVFTSAYGGRTQMFAVEKTNGTFAVREVWRHKAQGYMSTPVVLRDHVWLHLRNQRITGLDLRDGTERWTTDKSFGKYWSLVSNGERLLALDESGKLFLLAGTPEKFEILDSFKISEHDTWAHLVLSGDVLFVRERNVLAAWQWREHETAKR